VNDSASGQGGVSPQESQAVRYYKKDFWKQENLNYSRPHYRLQKSARVVRKLAGQRQCTLLDVGCGPATLSRLLPANVSYYGIDIAIHDPAPNLIEIDTLEAPVEFKGMSFDLIVAQGFFEYMGSFQDQKLAEIAKLLNEHGRFLASYVNFDHRHKKIYWPYSNVQSFAEFRDNLAQHFEIKKIIPTSHNWNHSEPNRRLTRVPNMYLDARIPLLSAKLAVEYFFICAPHRTL
jgi:SAM-dependent methyltransferase